ncbi:pentatricopeptide repeat-containing protein At5g27270 isoform X2 [Nymphaea colorata]|uniref:pentatricopeptide repeat-containing protein At5g27270 isoform X2 n=1 Tax=Nymphaea colorata TaxID=210225 RepID=UPI00129D6DEA|nr:pentatricopeptide repeat-containing protein At5g27270 isoform X2 [Nymphaea colorata]
METLLNSSFLPPYSPPGQHPLPYFFPPLPKSLKPLKPRNDRNTSLFASVPSVSANWTLSDGNSRKTFRRNLRKKPLSDDDARRIIKERARYLSVLRRNQGSQAQAPKWIRRTPEQMAQLLKDDRDGHIYGKHVVAAIKTVRGLSTRPEGSYDMRQVMSSFITKLTFREMCIVLKEQRGWRQARDFFWWMKLQKKSLHEEVLRMWEQIIELAVTPNHFTYTIAINSYARKGLLEEALCTLRRMKNSGLVPEELTYSLLISLCLKLNQQANAVELYEDMKSQGVTPSNYMYASMLSLYQKEGEYTKALALFSEMARNKIAADEVIYGIMIRIYGKLGLYMEAESTFKEVEQLGLLNEEKTYVAMVQVRLNAGKYDMALSLLEQMQSRNIPFSMFAYSTLLHCHVCKEDVAAAESTFQVMSKMGTPDSSACNDLLSLYVKLGLLKKAKAFILNLKNKKIKFDMPLYRTVIKVYGKEGLVNQAEELVNEMQSYGLELDDFTKTSLVRMYGESGKMIEAENTFKALEKPDAVALSLMLQLHLGNGDDIKINGFLTSLLETSGGLEAASHLIRKFVKSGEINKAEKLHFLVVELGEKPGDTSIASLISFYGRQHQLRQAKKVFNSVTGSSAVGRPVYSSMVDAYARCGNLEEANRLYEEMVAQGLGQDAVTISVMVNAFTNHGRFQDAEMMIHRSFEENVELDTIAYNTFIKAMLESGKLLLAANIYDRMASSGVPTSLQTYSTMISVYGKAGNLDKASEMFNTVLSADIKVDEKAYTNMITCYGKAGRTSEAFALFNGMKKEGIRPGKISYDTMINAFAVAGLYEQAQQLFQTMQSEGYCPDTFTHLALTRAYLEGKKYLEAEEIIHVMRNKGLRPTCAYFNEIITAYSKAGLVTDAERVYVRISETGIAPDISCYRTMLRTYMENGCLDEGISFFRSIYRTVKPDIFILSAAVHLYEHAGMKHEAEDVLEFLNMHGLAFQKNLRVGRKVVQH